MTIAAIETIYAGCRFRSRLEARWAVFFDHLSIKWEYEPQGYEFDGWRYLPDFWLADHNLAVEVKGAMDQAGARKIAGFAAHGHAVLILGDTPRPGTQGPHHWLVDGRTGAPARWRVTWLWSSAKAYQLFPFGWPQPVHQDAPDLATRLGEPPADGVVLASSKVTTAYGAARSARFEHGEAPAAPPRKTPAPPPAPTAPATTRYVVDDRVVHDKFGLGTVIAADSVGQRAVVTIDFGGHGTVRLMMIPGVPLRRAA